MKLCSSALAAAALYTVCISAFPRFDADASDTLKARSVSQSKCPYSSPQESAQGEEACPHLKSKLEKRATFDPVAQKVSTSGAHAWIAPKSGDQRGPCPGLNALANHGYLPHNGVADIPTITQAVNTVYGMSVDFGAFLAIYGTLFDGNALSLKPGYSIGGPTTLEAILGGTGILSTPTGLSGSHNNYEGDTSPTRGDLYLKGNDYLLQLDQFQQYYNALPENTPAPQQYNALFPFRQARFNDSISKNPYFFFPQFAGVLVAPAGYAFPPAMMANHSAKYPDGYLDKQTFKSFFAVSGNSGAFKYTPGWERIPDVWYRRPINDEYTITDFNLNVVQYGLQDPRLLSPGGNTGTPNSFVGVNPTDLSKGVFNAQSLAQGNNLACFTLQAVQSEAPGLVTGLYKNVAAAVAPLAANINKNLAGLNCPKLVSVDQSQYNKYPGYQRAKGP